MNSRWLIVDGYSFIHRDTACKRWIDAGNLLHAREEALRRISEIAGTMTDHITVVFDGQGKGTVESTSPRIDVVFSPSHQTADTVIERLVHDAIEPDGIMVVTADRAVRENVVAAGGHAMSCTQFIENMESDRTARHRSRKGGSHRPPTLGDFFPSPSD